MSTPNPKKDEEYSECLMGSVVTPGEYWLVSKNPAHTLEVQKLERELCDLYDNNTEIPHPDEINTTDCIAVECPPEIGAWKRGRAVTRLGRVVFKVFLVDSGQVIQVTVKRIRNSLDPKFLKVEPLAFKFCLYGIVPCIVQPDQQKRVTLKWTDESRYFVNNLLSKKQFFHIKVVHMLKRTLLGDIYLFNKPSHQFYSLGRLLCAKNLAIYAESYYREKVMLLEHSLVDNRFLVPDCEVSVHMDEKLKRMEELRLVNMQQEYLRRKRERGGNESESDDNEELEESALCDNSSQLAQDLFYNLNFKLNLRCESVCDFREEPPMSSSMLGLEVDEEAVNGSRDEQLPLESVKRKPCSTSLMKDQAPRPLMEKQSPGPLMEREIPKSVKENPAKENPAKENLAKENPVKENPAKQNQAKENPLAEKLAPKPLMEIELPKPLMEKPGLKPLMGIEIPKQVMEKPGPKPLMGIEIPKPLMGIEIPKPLPGIAFRMPPLGKEPMSVAETETPKPLMGRQIFKSYMDFGKREPLTKDRTLNSLMKTDIPKPDGEDKVSEPCNENNLSRAVGVKKQTDGQKKTRKEFRIIFDEKYNFPSLEVSGFYDVFHVFFDNVLEPLDHFKNLNISKMLFRNIEKQIIFEQPTPIQRWAIPSIVNGDDLVIIGEPKSGKTLSYIFGILEVLKLKMEVGQFHLGRGPTAVILSSSSRTCEFIYRILTLLITRKDQNVKVPLCKLNIRLVNALLVDRYSMSHTVNHSDILISTPQCLLRILNNRSVEGLEKLDVLVFDGADINAGEPFLSEMKLLLNQSKIPKNVQKIFCGEQWTRDFEVLTRTFVKDHSAVIGSFLEAAAYANVQPSVYFIKNSEKNRILLDITVQKFKERKIVIVCNNSVEVFHVEKFFKGENKICSIAHSQSNVEALKTLRYGWGRSKDSYVLVCTEDIIEHLGIYNADVLINYSLPTDREFSFGGRLSLLTGKMADYIFKRKVRPSVVFLIGDMAYFRLPELVDLTNRYEIQIPPKLEKKVENEIRMSEKELPLCMNVLQFGKCKDVWKCRKRHTFIKEIDFPANPLCGIVKFLILKVHDTTHLSVRIVELSDQQNNYKKVTFPDLSLHITRQLRNILREKGKRKPLSSVKVNTLCVLNRNDASGMRFHRARIVEVNKYNPSQVVVKLIDWGYVLRANAAKLLEIPQEVESYPPLSMDVYLCNLMPKNYDRDWSDRDVSFAKTMFLMELEENQMWVGRIKLSLESALLLDPVKLCHIFENENNYVIEFSVPQKLVYSGIADERPEHLKTLYAMCEKADVDTTIYEYNLEAAEKSCQAECAHFDSDFLKIQFIYAESPSSLFVRISKFEELLMSLEEECNEDGTRQTNSNNCKLNNPVLRKKLSVGICCLALNGNSWNRAKILAFERDRAKVFFIDYGDTEYVEHVVPIPDKLLTKLPSQAIECYLAGVKPEKKINQNVLAEIYSFSENGSEELYVSVVERVVKSHLTGGWKYGINLLNSEGKSLNKRLIAMGLVKPTENHTIFAIDMNNIPQAVCANETEAETWDEDDCGDRNKDKVDLSQFENNLSIVDSASGNDVNKALAAPEGNDDLSYFLKMESGVFDDDNACCMLEEFLCNLAPEQVNRREPQNEANTDIKEENTDKKEDEPVPENNEVVVQEEEKEEIIPQKAPQEEPNKEIVENGPELDEAAAIKARLNYLMKRSRAVNTRTLPYLKIFPDKYIANARKNLIPTAVHTPEILWSQTFTEIEVKIMLNNVTTYKFDCTGEKFIFRCILDKKSYLSNVRLFGGVSPDITRVEIKAFFVQIIFPKLCPLLWPRLCKENKKFRWIKYNIEHFKEKKCTISEILCSQAMERIKSGNIIVPKVSNEIKFVPSSSSEGSEWSDSEGEEV